MPSSVILQLDIDVSVIADDTAASGTFALLSC
jgi:hypothetical protein